MIVAFAQLDGYIDANIRRISNLSKYVYERCGTLQVTGQVVGDMLYRGLGVVKSTTSMGCAIYALEV